MGLISKKIVLKLHRMFLSSSTRESLETYEWIIFYDLWYGSSL